jgi:Zn-dependent alcohol dehydrogenase
MATMKAAVIHEAGGPEVLKIESLPIPTPKGGEILIRVKATATRSPVLPAKESTATRYLKGELENRRHPCVLHVFQPSEC